MRPRSASAAQTTTDRPAMFARAAASLRFLGLSPRMPPAPGDDAELWSLRDRWVEARDAFAAAMRATNRAEKDVSARLRKRGSSTTREQVESMFHLPDLEADQDAKSDEENAVVVQIVATPARTLAGIAFKAEVSEFSSHDNPDLVASIMDDVRTVAAAQTQTTAA